MDPVKTSFDEYEQMYEHAFSAEQKYGFDIKTQKEIVEDIKKLLEIKINK